jgi:hypothetical protein
MIYHTTHIQPGGIHLQTKETNNSIQVKDVTGTKEYAQSKLPELYKNDRLFIIMKQQTNFFEQF